MPFLGSFPNVSFDHLGVRIPYDGENDRKGHGQGDTRWNSIQQVYCTSRSYKNNHVWIGNLILVLQSSNYEVFIENLFSDSLPTFLE